MDLEEEERNQYQYDGIWTREMQAEHQRRQDMVDQEWDEAERLSRAAGHPFTNRRGERENEKEEMVAMAVRTYLVEHGADWHHVQDWLPGQEPQKSQGGKRRGSDMRPKAKNARYR